MNVFVVFCFSASHHRHLLKNSQTYGNKKRRGSKVSLRAYPCSQAFALPPDKDKQRKACPRQVIYIHTIHLTLHSILSIYTK